MTQKSKLVTLAIHTYQKAQIVKAFLEGEGMDVSLQNVNQTQPEVSSGVRIRIKESDLPRALRLVENSQLLHGEENPVSAKSHKRTILIPVDFSEYSIQACELGFNYAKDTEAEIAVLHAFFSPLFPDTLAFNEPFNHQNINEESKDFLLDKAQEDLDRFEAFIRKKVMDKEWPDVHFTCVLRDGLPEVEIENYSKQVKAEMIIMGTRGKDQKDVELIGSVTAEVIETVKIPVLAIPEKTPFHTLSQVRKIAFGTSFEQRDLIAIDQLFTMLKSYRIDYYLFHLTHQPNVWNEIKLAGIKDYFLKQYPDIPIHYKIMGANDPVLNLEKFVRDESIDIISLSTYKRNLFSRIFNPSIARKMLFHTDTPLLALRF